MIYFLTVLCIFVVPGACMYGKLVLFNLNKSVPFKILLIYIAPVVNA